jgi:triosephosphate isomerase
MQLDLNGSIQLAQDLRMSADTLGLPENTDVVICPSFDALATISELMEGSPFRIGAQDVFWQERGAYTGEVSASMLKAVGAGLVIIGHSERRKYLGEDDTIVNKKVKAALAEHLIPVICVGETYEERRAGHTDLILARQVIEGLKGLPLERSDHIIVAYEPVWVIGTGQAIDPSMAEHASDVIEQSLIDLFPADVIEHQTNILYGGSVDDSNIKEYVSLPKIHGVLVGTASLNAEKFLQLIDAM